MPPLELLDEDEIVWGLEGLWLELKGLISIGTGPPSVTFSGSISLTLRNSAPTTIPFIASSKGWGDVPVAPTTWQAEMRRTLPVGSSV